MATTPVTTVDLGFDRNQLEGLIGAVAADPAKGQTVWKARTSWLGGFRSQAEIRGFTIAMDEPSPLGGSDTAPNMVEVVLGAYGCCLTTGYVMNAARQGIALDAVEIELEGDLDLQGFFDLSAEALPGYSALRVNVRLTAPTAEADQLRGLHDLVVRTSPVGSIISRPVTVATSLVEVNGAAE